MGRFRHRIAGLLLLTLLLAACGQPSSGGAATTVPASQTTAAPASTGAQPVADLKGRKLTIGSDTTYPPMEYVDEQTKQIVGFDVDMMGEIGKLINAEPQFKTFPSFDAIFAALANKEFDLVVSSVSITDERKKIIAFSEPYLSIGQAIVVQQSNTTITKAEDLKNAALVGTQRGTTSEKALKDVGVADAKVKLYDTIDLAFQDLANGAVDAVVTDGPPATRYAAQFNGKLKVVGGPFTTEDYGIALQQGDTELLNAINAALKELKANGTMQRLMDKWDLSKVARMP